MEMGSEGGESLTYLIEHFEEAPEQFEFFQAVRLIQNLFLRMGDANRHKLLEEVVHLSESGIRFRTEQSLAFSPSDVRKIQAKVENDELKHFEITASFLGLTGPNGVLPDHYTSLVIERSHTRNKDYALREFLNYFNNRALTFFYLAWQKYRLPFVYERSRLEGKGLDPISRSVISIAGHGQSCLQNRASFRDEALQFFSGFFSEQKRNAVSLECMLSFYFGVQAQVTQFCERWIYLSEQNQSQLPNQQHPQGMNAGLGKTTVIGRRYRDIQSLFRIQIGPLRWVEFLRFLPGMSEMKSLISMTNHFAGLHLDFEIQLLVRADRVPPMQFGLGGANPLALGQTTWLGTPDPNMILDSVVFRYGFGGRPFNEE